MYPENPKFRLALMGVAITVAVVCFAVYRDWGRQVGGGAKNVQKNAQAAKPCPRASPGKEIWVPSGEQVIGDDRFYAEESPERKIAVAGFFIDSDEVSNRRFATFVSETGYRTVAERPPDLTGLTDVPPEYRLPGSAVFDESVEAISEGRWWRWVPGANWRHPEGPQSSIDGRPDDPVVQIAYEDALAYSKWAGRSLPTEEEWEYAARAGTSTVYPWGDDPQPNGKAMANTWQGAFPAHNSKEDGFLRSAPVGCFPPNAFGLYDMIGNVWEWTSAPWTSDHGSKGEVPTEAQMGRYVIKGGSFLCADNYCLRYRGPARQAQETGLGTNHLGFRTVRRVKPR